MVRSAIELSATAGSIAGSMSGMATTVLHGGALFDGRRYVGPGALVLRDDRIAAVLAGPVPLDRLRDHARMVDVAGGLVAPGFVDAHVHAVQGGLERIRCDLSGLATREDYLELIREYAEAHPEVPWILGGGWSMAAFPGGTPTAAD